MLNKLCYTLSGLHDVMTFLFLAFAYVVIDL